MAKAVLTTADVGNFCLQHCNLMKENFLIISKQDNMTITLAPGYVLSRSKEKINVTITDTVFKEGTTKVS